MEVVGGCRHLVPPPVFITIEGRGVEVVDGCRHLAPPPAFVTIEGRGVEVVDGCRHLAPPPAFVTIEGRGVEVVDGCRPLAPPPAFITIEGRGVEVVDRSRHLAPPPAFITIEGRGVEVVGGCRPMGLPKAFVSIEGRGVEVVGGCRPLVPPKAFITIEGRSVGVVDGCRPLVPPPAFASIEGRGLEVVGGCRPMGLPQAFVKRNIGRIGQIQTANPVCDGDAEMGIGVVIQEFCRKAFCLTPEDQHVGGFVLHIPEGFLRSFREKPQPTFRIGFREVFEAFVLKERHTRPIVQSRTPHIFVFQGKPQFPDQVQGRVCAGASSRDGPCISWDFRSDQNNMHEVSQSGVDDDFPIVSNPFAGFDSGHASLDTRARHFGDHESTGR